MTGDKRLSPFKGASTSNKKIKATWKWQFFHREKVHVGVRGSLNHFPLVAAFDFDWTLWKTKSGAVFTKNKDDFEILDDTLPSRFAALSKTHKIVIFSNQHGVAQGKCNIQDVMYRVESVMDTLLGDDVSCTVFLVLEHNLCRKPRRGMFDLFLKHFHDREIDYDGSFFVGDAAGRPAHPEAGKEKKDHSSADYLFARNIGFRFFLPEDFISDNCNQTTWEKNCASLPLPFDPKSLKEINSLFAVEEASGDKLDVNQLKEELKLIESREPKIMVVIIGLPASGKSSFRKELYPSYEVISQDILGSANACEKHCQRLVEQSTCKVVVDNTNVQKSHRQTWISLAKKANCFVYAIWIITETRVCLHNNLFRRLSAMMQGKDSKEAKMVPSFVINNLQKKFENPTIGEGFSKLYQVSFRPTFSDKNLESLYFQFLDEK